MTIGHLSQSVPLNRFSPGSYDIIMFFKFDIPLDNWPGDSMI